MVAALDVGVSICTEEIEEEQVGSDYNPVIDSEHEVWHYNCLTEDREVDEVFHDIPH
jgi:hypothetical protein